MFKDIVETLVNIAYWTLFATMTLFEIAVGLSLALVLGLLMAFLMALIFIPWYLMEKIGAWMRNVFRFIWRGRDRRRCL